MKPFRNLSILKPKAIAVFMMFMSFLNVSSCRVRDTTFIESDQVSTKARITLSPTFPPRIFATATSTVTPSPTPTKVPPEPALLGTPMSQSHEVISDENIGELVELARLGNGIAYETEFSPDGTLLAVHGSMGIDLYDSGTFSLRRSVHTKSPPTDFAFSPDGDSLAISTLEEIILTRVSDSANIETVNQGARSIEFSSDGRSLYFSFFTNCVNPSNEKVFYIYKLDLRTSHILEVLSNEECIRSIVSSPGGEYIAARGSYSVFVWELPDLELIYQSEPTPIQGSPYDVHLSSDAKHLFIVSYGYIRVIDLLTGEPLCTLNPNSGLPMYSGSLSPDDHFFASVSDSVYIWQLDRCLLYGNYGGNYRYFRSISWSPTNEYLAVVSDYPKHGYWPGVIIIKPLSMTPEHFLGSYSNRVDTLAWSDDGGRIAVGYGDGWVRVIGVGENQIVDEYPHEPPRGLSSIAHKETFTSLLFLMNGDKYVAGKFNGFEERDLSSGDVFSLLGEEGGEIASSNDGKLIASLSYDFDNYNIRLWSLPEWNLVHSWQFTADIRYGGLQFGNQDNMLLLGSGNRLFRTILNLDIDSETLDGLHVDDKEFHSFRFSPIGTSFVTARRDGNLILYREGLSPIAVNIPEIEGSVVGYAANFIDWSPDGELVAYGALDGTIYFIDGHDGEILRYVKGHPQWVNVISFSSNGSYLATGSIDGSVRIWGIQP